MGRGDNSAATIDFGEKIFSIINQGSKSATYKYAVLLGLIDLCLEGTGRDGSPPEMVTTLQLAEKILAMYWPQSEPFGQSGSPLRQFNDRNKQAKIITLISQARSKSTSADILPVLRRKNPKVYGKLLKDVEWKIIEDPLPRLQLVPQLTEPFIYRINWDLDVKKRDYRNLDNRILFIADAGLHLVKLSGLLRPMLQQEWIRWVSNNTGIQDRLGKYLFPEGRTSLERVRNPLLDIQKGNCFYCGRGIRGDAEVDHFMPWSRVHNDDLGNLVAAHKSCNSSKSSHLPSVRHLEHWMEHIKDNNENLISIADDVYWDFNPASDIGMVTGIYVHLPEDMRLWDSKDVFTGINKSAVREALGVAS